MAQPPKSSTRATSTATRISRPKAAVKVADAATPVAVETPAVAAPSNQASVGADDQTVLRTAVRPETPPSSSNETRKHTLATAISRPSGDTPPPSPVSRGASTNPRPAFESAPTAPITQRIAALPVANEVTDAVTDEVDGWSAADQPTIYLPPRAFLQQRPANPQPRAVAPRPRPAEFPVQAPRPAPTRDVRGQAAPPLRPAFALGEERLAAPDGRIAPNTPPPGVPRAALANPRMSRFQELRQQRMSMDPEQREAEGGRPVTESVRQWWGDLLPGVERALRHQHDAQASGVHPLSPHDETPATRLGDAFGRLATSARQLSQRTQAAVAPTLRRLHDQAEQHAQAFVEKVEGTTARQQAPLLGPGRIAVFFNNGVTVSHAHALLAAYQARPIRLIPRKHGFLAVVRPGLEAETAESLRDDQNVRDVAYLEFDEFGHPIEPR